MRVRTRSGSTHLSLAAARAPRGGTARFALGAEPPLVLAGESVGERGRRGGARARGARRGAAAAAEAVAADGDGDGEVTEAERRAALAARAVVVETEDEWLSAIKA